METLVYLALALLFATAAYVYYTYEGRTEEVGTRKKLTDELQNAYHAWRLREVCGIGGMVVSAFLLGLYAAVFEVELWRHVFKCGLVVAGSLAFGFVEYQRVWGAKHDSSYDPARGVPDWVIRTGGVVLWIAGVTL